MVQLSSRFSAFACFCGGHSYRGKEDVIRRQNCLLAVLNGVKNNCGLYEEKQVKIRLLSSHIVKNFLVLLLKIAYADNRPTQ